MYVDELRKVFCKVAHISNDELRIEQWRARLGLILNDFGYPLATLSAKGSRVPIRESVAKLRKLLETGVDERALIAKLKIALAERVYEIQTAKAAGIAKSRAGAAANRRRAYSSTPSEVLSRHTRANISLCSITK